MTIQEVTQAYFVRRETVMYHIHRGNLKCRLAGSKRGVYLIDLGSLVKLWGEPPKMPIYVGTK